MRRFAFAAAVAAVLMIAAPILAGWTDEPSFEVKADRALKLKVPAVTLSEADVAALLAGKPVTRLLEGEGGLKKGWMRLIVPYEPPTVWRVITNVEYFDHQSSEYPANGSLTKKLHTYMPYTFDTATCTENGKWYMYQLLVMPFVDPRHFTLERFNNRAAFPWESTWHQAPEMHCQSGVNPEVEEYRKSAVATTKNTGTWQIGPLPKEWVKSKEDLLKTDMIYYVDSNPGGNLAAVMPVVNKATKIALPALADSVLFHCKNWSSHAAKYQQDDTAKWKGEIAAYRKAVGYE